MTESEFLNPDCLQRDASQVMRDIEIVETTITRAPSGVMAIVSPRSSHWRKVRENHLKKHPVCEACGSKDNLEVHHKQPFHLFPKLELEQSNLMTLCSSGPGKMNCHLVIGHCGKWTDYNGMIAHAISQFRSIMYGRVTG